VEDYERALIIREIVCAQQQIQMMITKMAPVMAEVFNYHKVKELQKSINFNAQTTSSTADKHVSKPTEIHVLERLMHNCRISVDDTVKNDFLPVDDNDTDTRHPSSTSQNGKKVTQENCGKAYTSVTTEKNRNPYAGYAESIDSKSQTDSELMSVSAKMTKSQTARSLSSVSQKSVQPQESSHMVTSQQQMQQQPHALSKTVHKSAGIGVEQTKPKLAAQSASSNNTARQTGESTYTAAAAAAPGAVFQHVKNEPRSSLLEPQPIDDVDAETVDELLQTWSKQEIERR